MKGMSEGRKYYLVAPLAFTGAATGGIFTYHSETELPLGSVVEVPIGRRKSLGVVLETSERPEFVTKGVTRALEVEPIPDYLVKLAAWMSEYYAVSPASVWTTFLPSGLGKKRRAIKEAAAAEAADAAATAETTLPGHALTKEQTAALESIRRSDKTVHLLKGVTGSGKTRLYLELAAEALAAGRSVVMLVPEILLTPQLTGQFEAAFGGRVLTTHSKLTEAQRDRVWRAASAARAAGRPLVVVGPRSSLFLPLHDPGLVVVDECHETSYKQDQHPRYNALAAAAQLGRLTGARVVFGSATPGLGELFLARAGRLNLVELRERVLDRPLPAAAIIDLRDKSLLKTSKFISAPLGRAVGGTLAAGRQSLLYINRRGSASSQICGDCGHVTTCPECRLPFTFHADLMRLICHHCGRRAAVPAVCPPPDGCGGANLRLLGGGTKRIEEEARRLWPEARIARLDRDSATLEHLQAVYAGLTDGSIDILVGTQMITKGLDLPAVDTVGVVSADTMLHLPDFSAAERTFQLLTQVAGRAGRGDRAGQVFIQTYNPDHPAITAAAKHDYDLFAAAELEHRRALGYPPYAYLLKLTLSAADRDAAAAQAADFAAKLRAHPGLSVAGPAPAFLETVGGRHHWVISVTSHRRAPLVQVARQLPSDHWTADLDPLNLL